MSGSPDLETKIIAPTIAATNNTMPNPIPNIFPQHVLAPLTHFPSSK